METNKSAGSWLTGLVAALFISGCGISFGSGPTPGSRINPNEFHPTVARVQHPDTTIHLDRSREQLRRRWSATYRDLQGGRIFRTRVHRTFATLWSKELAMVELLNDAKDLNMTKEAAEIMVDEAADEYMKYVKFDVHVFVNMRYEQAFYISDLSSLNTEFELRTANGATYSPTQLAIGELDVVRTLSLEPDAFYRINSVYFPRFVDDQDILENVDALELYVRTRRVPFATLSFNWRFAS